ASSARRAPQPPDQAIPTRLDTRPSRVRAHVPPGQHPFSTPRPLHQLRNSGLQAVVLHHVLDIRAKAKELADYDRADWPLAAIGGLPIDFDRSPAGVSNAGVVAADIIAANGVIHVVDTVLLEPDPGPPSPNWPLAHPTFPSWSTPSSRPAWPRP
ncbi:MAG: fasciclin domain-containing protein, partial [Acidimicrobiales bacterium]